MMKRPKFSTAMVFFAALTGAGMVLMNLNTHFYEATYEAHLVSNGKVVENSLAYITLERPHNNFVFRFLADNSQNQLLKKVAGSVAFDCELKNTQFTKIADNKGVLVATPHGYGGYCSKLTFVWDGIENVTLTLPSGAVMSMKRITPKDPIINSTQKRLFKRFTVLGREVS